MGKINNIIGKKYGRLTVLSLHHKKVYSKSTKLYYLCQCECGNTVIVSSSSLNSGFTKSCGCLQKEMACKSNSTHHKSDTRLYRIWSHMKERCYKEKSKSYKNYGARGITICNEWKNNFENFYNWAISNGYKDELSIERINNNGNYEPSNCKWATAKEQSRNKRNTTQITYNGETHCFTDWSKILNKSVTTLRNRILVYNWSVEKAFTA